MAAQRHGQRVNEAMHILIVGAGSTGGYFGARLASAGRDVTFLVRPARYEQLREHGLHVVSPYGNLDVTPKLILAQQLEQTYDVILLGVKAYALETAMQDFSPSVGADSMIVPMLNGMRHVARLKDAFGARAVIGGLCRVHGNLDAQGRIVQMTKLHDLEYGEFDGAVSPRIRALHSLLSDAGFDTRLSVTIEADMWEKWVLLATLGCATCLMRGNIGEIVSAPGGKEFLSGVLAETSAVAAASGYPPRAPFLASANSLLFKSDSKMTSSMYRDLTEGRPVEATQIVGDLLERGRGLHVNTPLLQLAADQLSIYQARLEQDAGAAQGSSTL